MSRTYHQEQVDNMIAYFEYLMGGEEGASLLVHGLDSHELATLFNRAVFCCPGHFRLAAILCWREIVGTLVQLNKENSNVN